MVANTKPKPHATTAPPRRAAGKLTEEEKYQLWLKKMAKVQDEVCAMIPAHVSLVDEFNEERRTAR